MLSRGYLAFNDASFPRFWRHFSFLHVFGCLSLMKVSGHCSCTAFPSPFNISVRIKMLIRMQHVSRGPIFFALSAPIIISRSAYCNLSMFSRKINISFCVCLNWTHVWVYYQPIAVLMLALKSTLPILFSIYFKAKTLVDPLQPKMGIFSRGVHKKCDLVSVAQVDKIAL